MERRLTPTLTLVVHRHEYGVNTELFATEDEARAYIATAIMEYMNDTAVQHHTPEDKEQILEQFREGDIQAGVEIWEEITDEGFFLHQVHVQRDQPSTEDAKMRAVEQSLKLWTETEYGIDFDWTVEDYVWAAYRLKGYEGAVAALKAELDNGGGVK